MAPEGVSILTGTNWRTIEVIEVLETDLGRPVFTANKVTMWATLPKLRVQPHQGYGSVFGYR
jgi:maleate cis-trans isomerase